MNYVTVTSFQANNVDTAIIPILHLENHAGRCLINKQTKIYDLQCLPISMV